MTLIPGLTVVRKPMETYLTVRESDGDRELTAAECELLHELASGASPQQGQPRPEVLTTDQIWRDYCKRSLGDERTLRDAIDYALCAATLFYDGTYPQKVEPDDLTSALVAVIDGWRSRRPELTYFEVVTVIEGLARLLSNLRDEAEGRPLATVIPFGAAIDQEATPQQGDGDEC